jgi:hypothetical protein
MRQAASTAKTIGDLGIFDPEDERNDHVITAIYVRDPIGETSYPDPPDTEPFIFSGEDLRKHDENVRDALLLELVTKNLAIGTSREVISKTLFLSKKKFAELVKKSKSDRRKAGPREGGR